ncbi:CoA ester lyase [Variovorax sp. J22G40]|uniref:HpcH/HpaI aldolase/citrate lyase family protein n=2 Tax=unclassified Variovorax TaxID=663243 RepID=UPI002576E139|nr:CoA ester lyase [Variovorax sp. J22G40]MDM0089952.1 CoA ester lyase [Variovorax sp. J22G40]
MTLTASSRRPRRSAMYVPATNLRALSKVGALDCDTVILDLEDAVAPDMKEAARRNIEAFFATPRDGLQERVIRVNAVDTPDFEQDMATVAACRPDAVLVPKLSRVGDFAAIAAALQRHGPHPALRLWAMVETPAALLSLDEIVGAGLASQPRLECLVVGTNDIAKETGVSTEDGRIFLLPWLMHVVLCAKRHGVCVLDGVWNDFADQAGFATEAAQSVKMAFDGKTLIHPAQIDPANRAFSPSVEAVAQARQVVAIFARPENAGAGVVNLDGRMVERLHLAQARALLALCDAVETRRASRR